MLHLRGSANKYEGNASMETIWTTTYGLNTIPKSGIDSRADIYAMR